MNNAQTKKDFAENYKDFIDNNLYLAVSSFMSLAKIHQDLFLMVGEFDEAIEYFDFEEWFVGGHNKKIEIADNHIRRAEKSLEKLTDDAWRKVGKCMKTLSKESKIALFGKDIAWNKRYASDLFEAFEEWGVYPYNMDEAFDHFCKVVKDLIYKDIEEEKKSENDEHNNK